MIRFKCAEKGKQTTEGSGLSKVFKGSRPVHTENLAFRVAKRRYNNQDTTTKQFPNSNNSNEILKQDQNGESEKLKARSYQLEASRFGFVISNKISKLATRRNALKRQLRAIIEQELPNLKPGYDIVIMVKSDFSYPYQQDGIRAQVKEGLTKAMLWR